MKERDRILRSLFSCTYFLKSLTFLIIKLLSLRKISENGDFLQSVQI